MVRGSATARREVIMSELVKEKNYNGRSTKEI